MTDGQAGVISAKWLRLRKSVVDPTLRRDSQHPTCRIFVRGSGLDGRFATVHMTMRFP